MREFNYVNDLGFHKRIVVGIKKNSKYPITLWDMEHGEYCGSGNVTAQELNEFLEHYGIKERMD